MAVLAITDANFEGIVSGDLPVLLDCYADWCAPCRQMAPIVEALSNELAGRAIVGKLDVDHNPQTAARLRASSIPLFVVFHRGEMIAHRPGAVPKKALLDMLAPVLPPADFSISVALLRQEQQQGSAKVVDIRDAGSYGRFRIPGAIHVEQADLESKLAELAGSVLYTRTDEALDVARRLRSLGGDVRGLEGGFLAWESAGFSVEK